MQLEALPLLPCSLLLKSLGFTRPEYNQIRNILDGIQTSDLTPIFTWVYQALKSGGHLKAYQVLGENLLVPLDGTEYFSSEKIHCPCCSS